MIGDAPLRRYRWGESAPIAPDCGLHMHTHWRLLSSPHRVTSTCLGDFTVAQKPRKTNAPDRFNLPEQTRNETACHHRRSSPGWVHTTSQQMYVRSHFDIALASDAYFYYIGKFTRFRKHSPAHSQCAQHSAQRPDPPRPTRPARLLRAPPRERRERARRPASASSWRSL